MKLHLFFPENDLALAAGIENYTAPLAARHLHEAGAALPFWYGDSADMVLCPDSDAKWIDTLRRLFDIRPAAYCNSFPPDIAPAPWGWSAAARRIFKNLGYDDTGLPTSDAISKMRMLSHRRTAAAVTEMLADELPPGIEIAPAACEAHTLDEATAILDKLPRAMMKSPWSSSGRGVLDTGTVSASKALKTAADTIRRQGSVMIERVWDKAIDFALLFDTSSGTRFIGTSVFETDGRGTYSGNLLAPEHVRRRQVEKFYPTEKLDALTQTLCRIIDREIAPWYKGVLGVDMLITPRGVPALLEINLRHTMGYVANRFAEMHLHPDSVGEYRVSPVSDCIIMPGTTDLVISDSRLASGTLMLTSPNPYFTFTVSARRR